MEKKDKKEIEKELEQLNSDKPIISEEPIIDNSNDENKSIDGENIVDSNEVVKKKKIKKGDIVFYSIISFLILVLVTVIILNTVVFTNVIIDGPSMENTVFNGDVLLCKKNTAINRGDVIVIKIAERGDTNNKVIKRLIGFAGDEITFKDGYVYRLTKEEKEAGQLEPKKLDEPYVKEQGVTTKGKLEDTIIVPEGKIFFLGDNRLNSNDSRGTLGYRTMSDVLGVVTESAIRAKGFTTVMYKIMTLGGLISCNKG